LGIVEREEGGGALPEDREWLHQANHLQEERGAFKEGFLRDLLATEMTLEAGGWGWWQKVDLSRGPGRFALERFTLRRRRWGKFRQGGRVSGITVVNADGDAQSSGGQLRVGLPPHSKGLKLGGHRSFLRKKGAWLAGDLIEQSRPITP